jgi:hypothetical protein
MDLLDVVKAEFFVVGHVDCGAALEVCWHGVGVGLGALKIVGVDLRVGEEEEEEKEEEERGGNTKSYRTIDNPCSISFLA